MISGFALDNDNDECRYVDLVGFCRPSKFKANVESNSVFERQAAGRTLCEAVESCDWVFVKNSAKVNLKTGVSSHHVVRGK